MAKTNIDMIAALLGASREEAIEFYQEVKSKLGSSASTYEVTRTLRQLPPQQRKVQKVIIALREHRDGHKRDDTEDHPSPPYPEPAQPPLAQSSWWYVRTREDTAEQGKGYSPGDAVETRVVGVTFEGRQAIVAHLSVKERVWLRREPHNPHDRNAIRVERQNGQQIGYISRDIAAILASHFDNYGKPVLAVVTALTGEERPYSNRGVRIRFDVPEPSPPVDDLGDIHF